MNQYLLQGKYLPDGVKGLLAEGGTSRCAAIEKLVASCGGTVSSIHYAFGEYDLYVIFNMPDDSSVAAAAFTARATGAVDVRVIPLIDPKVMDAASKVSGAYRAPGQ